MTSSHDEPPTLKGGEATRNITERLHLCRPYEFETLVLHHLSKAVRWYETIKSKTFNTSDPPSSADRDIAIIQRASFSFLATHGYQLWPTQASQRQHLMLVRPDEQRELNSSKAIEDHFLFRKDGKMTPRMISQFKIVNDRLPDLEEICLGSHIGKLVAHYVRQLLKKSIVAMEKGDVEVRSLVDIILRARPFENVAELANVVEFGREVKPDSVVTIDKSRGPIFDSGSADDQNITTAPVSNALKAVTSALFRLASDRDTAQSDIFENELKIASRTMEEEMPDVSVAPQSTLEKGTSQLGNRSFVCPICNKLYQKRGPLNRHMQTKHQNNQLPWPCPIRDCSISYDNEYALNQHLQGHGSIVEVQWEQCPISHCTAKFSQLQVKRFHQHLNVVHAAYMVLEDAKVIFYDQRGHIVHERNVPNADTMDHADVEHGSQLDAPTQSVPAPHGACVRKKRRRLSSTRFDSLSSKTAPDLPPLEGDYSKYRHLAPDSAIRGIESSTSVETTDQTSLYGPVNNEDTTAGMLGPWSCPVINCHRHKVPYSTTGRLDFHMRSQHPGLPNHYRCRLCPHSTYLEMYFARHMSFHFQQQAKEYQVDPFIDSQSWRPLLPHSQVPFNRGQFQAEPSMAQVGQTTVPTETTNTLPAVHSPDGRALSSFHGPIHDPSSALTFAASHTRGDPSFAPEPRRDSAYAAGPLGVILPCSIVTENAFKSTSIANGYLNRPTQADACDPHAPTTTQDGYRLLTNDGSGVMSNDIERNFTSSQWIPAPGLQAHSVPGPLGDSTMPWSSKDSDFDANFDAMAIATQRQLE